MQSKIEPEQSLVEEDPEVRSRSQKNASGRRQLFLIWTTVIIILLLMIVSILWLLNVGNLHYYLMQADQRNHRNQCHLVSPKYSLQKQPAAGTHFYVSRNTSDLTNALVTFSGLLIMRTTDNGLAPAQDRLDYFNSQGGLIRPIDNSVTKNQLIESDLHLQLTNISMTTGSNDERLLILWTDCAKLTVHLASDDKKFLISSIDVQAHPLLNCQTPIGFQRDNYYSCLKPKIYQCQDLTWTKSDSFTTTTSAQLLITELAIQIDDFQSVELVKSKQFTKSPEPCE